MTNNVVAQFSCSLDKNGNFKEYRVVAGSLFDEEYSETLDSATIVLSHVKNEDRLSFILPYIFVRVFDKSSPYDPETGKYEFDNVYLLDTYDENEKNIKVHIWGYTINLMSQTKFLEKIQCPSLTITHKIVNGVSSKKTIYEKIREYMELYIPKIKYCDDEENWSYQSLIKIPDSDFYKLREAFSPLTAQNFQPIGDEWEATSYLSLSDLDLDVDINEIDLNTIHISDIRENGNIVFITRTVTYDSYNQRFVLYAVVRQEPQDNWESQVSFSFSFKTTVSKFYKKFNVPCADFSFTTPTLRQVLTTLMQQLGCIPTVKDRTLGFLDLQATPKEFGDGDYTVNNTVNYKRRGLSSDSYVNTLINTSSQVLDSGNDVVCESLGFRDWNNVIIKQEQNLYLQTKFPIYKIKSFIINAYVKADIDIKNIQSAREVGAGGSNHIARWSISINKTGNNTVVLDFSVAFNYDTNTYLDISGTFVAISYKTSTRTFTVSKTINGNSFQPGTDDKITFNVAESCDKFYFVGVLTVRDGTNVSASSGLDVFYSNFSKNHIGFLCLYTQDITKLLVEKSARQYLSPDFNAMIRETDENANPAPTLDILAKYIYGTVGYEIGSQKIEGFSEVYAVGQSTWLGWIAPQYTYIENIWNFIVKYYSNSIEAKVRSSLGNLPDITNGTYLDGIHSPGDQHNYEFNGATPYNPYQVSGNIVARIFSTGINFAYFWFDLRYQPLNSFNLAYVKSKEEVDYPLEQYDGNASGLTDFDRLSIHEQEQVDRIGNETLSISQRTVDFGNIQDFKKGPLLYRDDTNRDGVIDSKDKKMDYIIFKRSFSIENNYFKASYTGSKDAVLKNYFTSIRTKYRAYQYVDYSQSVLRKERDTFFVKISEKGFYDGDDHIFLGYFGQYNLEHQNEYLINFLGKWTYNYSGSSSNTSSSLYFGITRYCVLSDGNEQTKNDISSVSTDNFFAIIMEEVDNVGTGTYFDTDAMQQAQDNQGALLGGVPQSWQIWQDEYNDSHTVSYVSDLKMSDIFDNYIDVTSDAAADIKEDMSKIMRMPLLDEVFVDLHNPGQNNVNFSIVDNNKSIMSPNYKKTFYKDYSERLNYTVQFIYYTDSENIIWNEGFINLNGVANLSLDLGSYSLRLVDITGEKFELRKGEYTDTISYINASSPDIIRFRNGVTEKTNPFIEINWFILNDNITQFKVIALSGSTKKDIIAFKRKDSSVSKQRFFVSLNDTKTDYVLAEKDGILYRRFKTQCFTQLQKISDTAYQYLRNDGEQYINLDIQPSEDFAFEMKCEYDSDSNYGSETNPIMGYENESGEVSGPGVNGVNGNISIINHSTQTPDGYRSSNSDHTYIIRASYTSDLKGISIIKDLTNKNVFRGVQTGSSALNTNDLLLFALRSSNINKGIKIYYLKIWNNGVLVRDLIPANCDNTYGLFDRISNTAFTNQGSGDFTVGDEIEQVNCPRTVENIYND